MRTNSAETVVDDQESDAGLDVKPEGRYDETQRREDLVPHQQLKDEKLKHLNGDFILEDNDSTIWKKQKHSSGELDKLLNTHQRPHKQMLFPINTETDGDALKQKSERSKPQTGRHEPNRQLPDTNSKVYVCRPNTRGTPTANSQHEARWCEQNLNSSKVRLKFSDITWERPDHTVSQARTQKSSFSAVSAAEIQSVKHKKVAVAESVKQTKHAGVSVSVKSGPAQSNGHSPLSPSYVGHSHSPGRINKPTENNLSPSICKKVNNLNRNNNIQHPDTAHSSRRETTKPR